MLKIRTTIKIAHALALYLIVLAHFSSNATPLRPCLSKLSMKDTACAVWVIFSDKDASRPAMKVSKHALARRAAAGFASGAYADLPVTQRYILGVEQLGGKCKNVFTWANAASFSIRSAALPSLARLQYVKDILPVRTSLASVPPRRRGFRAKKAAAFDTSTVYGFSGTEMRIPAIPSAHDYIINTLKKNPGDGVIIGLFDSGFRLNHRCFDYIRSHLSVLADSNFVDNNGEVSDPDSIRIAFDTNYQSPPEEHGSWTLSLIAGYDPGKFMGVAWAARFALAKTEWVGRIIDGSEVDIEMHSEEDNWASAIVWAESLGVDIVSSSVAYRTDFTDSLGNLRRQDDYTFDDMDGKSTIISIAAGEAARRGMIIVNAAGNDGPPAGSINAPADVEDVIAVGGVATDKSVFYYSSRGPTADGRIKPDLVTQSTVMYLPDIYSADSASYFIGEEGTSFAAPVVAGICGLVRQLHPTADAADVRQRLYASCAFAPKQTAYDNSYGRGIPNALKACFIAAMDSTSINLKVFPTTIAIVRKNQQLKIRFDALPDNPLKYSQLAKVAIMAFDGSLVWGHTEYCRQETNVKLTWPESPRAYAPGMYYCIVNYAGKTYRRKFIVLP